VHQLARLLVEGRGRRQIEEGAASEPNAGEEGMMATSWVDFKQLKADVAIEQVLAPYDVHLRHIGAR
jgi:hypothetical protein